MPPEDANLQGSVPTNKVRAALTRTHPDVIAIFGKRRLACRQCPTKCHPLPNALDLTLVCPLPVPRWEPVDHNKFPIGDWIGKFAKPIARALGLDCIDPVTKELKKDSGCAGRTRRLNAAGKKLSDLISPPPPHAE